MATRSTRPLPQACGRTVDSVGGSARPPRAGRAVQGPGGSVGNRGPARGVIVQGRRPALSPARHRPPVKLGSRLLPTSGNAWNAQKDEARVPARSRLAPLGSLPWLRPARRGRQLGSCPWWGADGVLLPGAGWLHSAAVDQQRCVELERRQAIVDGRWGGLPRTVPRRSLAWLVTTPPRSYE